MQTNQIICGDAAQILKQLPANSVDLVVTSPPYDKQRKYNGYSFNFEAIATELTRVLKTGGVIIWVVKDATIDGSETLSSFRQALFFTDQCKLNIDTLIWHKPNPVPRKDDTKFKDCFEFVFEFSKGKKKHFTPPMVANKYAGTAKVPKQEKTTIGSAKEDSASSTLQQKNRVIKPTSIHPNIFSFTVGLHHSTSYKEAFQHPAIMPEKLAEMLISTYTKSGQIVLDPFCGSGTTLFAAQKLKRKFIGIDVSKEYCKLSRNRLK